MNTIRIYEKDETSFDHNGLCIIKPLSCVITRNLHEYKYFVELEYPLYTDSKWKELQEDRILHIFNDRFDDYFRIILTRKKNESIYIYAEHEFFTLERNFIADTNIVGKNMNQAIDQLLTAADFAHNFKGTSNIGNVNNCRIVRKNIITALIGSDENSLLTRWGIGELDMNKYTFRIDDKIGENKGYTVTYGKNLDSIQCEVDMSSVTTRIMPIGFDGITLPSESLYVDSPNINAYSVPIIKEYKYENVKWKGSPNYTEKDEEDLGAFVYENLSDAQNKLIELASLEFSENKVDKPEVTFDINFIDLAKTEEYKNYIQLLDLNIGDTVTVRHKKLGIDLQPRLIEYQYNCLTENFESVILGDYKKSFFKSVSDVTSDIEKLPETINSWLQNAKDHASDLINSALGGYVVKNKNELLIMDTDNINTARRVWRWNINGLGYSSNGYYGEYGLAMTMDGVINADFINSGVLNADIVKSGVLESRNGSSWINMETGDFNLANKVKYENNQFQVSVDGISDLSIGGRNLMVGTKNEITVEVNDSISTFEFDSYTTPYNMTFKSMGFKVGDLITISFDWKISKLNEYDIIYGDFGIEWINKVSNPNSPYLCDIKNPVITFSEDNLSGFDRTTIELDEISLEANAIRFKINNSKLKFSVSKLKVEKGGLVSDWTEAPEDLQENIDNTVNPLININQQLTERIDNAFSDGVITAYEKLQLSIDLKEIDAQYDDVTKIVTLYNNDAITGVYDEYKVIYENLHAVIDPCLKDMSKDTVFSKSTIRDLFFNYGVYYSHLRTSIDTYINSSFSSTNSSITALSDSVNIAITKSTNNENELNHISKHMSFSDDGWLELYADINGEKGRFKTQITDSKLAFIDDNNEVAYMSNQQLYINHAEVVNEMKVGNIVMSKSDKGGIMFRWEG